MGYITDTELIARQLSSETTVTDEKVIKDLIQKDSTSDYKQNMFDGVQYYKSNNTNIKERKFTVAGLDDIWRANNKIANGFLKVLIDQKINYSLAKPIIVNGCDNIIELIGVDKLVKKMCKESSKKAVEWCHPYINKKGEFKVVNISGQEVIPIYDNSFDAELMQIIRYYTIQVQEGNETKDRYKVEVWDKEKVTYYMQNRQGTYDLDVLVDPNPKYHWNEIVTQLGQSPIKVGHGWGKVPFVPLWNNDEHDSDLVPIKAHIDLYDIVESDFANNIEDLQDAVLKLINYGGVTNMAEFLQRLKRDKVLPLDSEGDAEYLTTQIPIEARSKMLEILRDNIFEFGQGVDVNKTGDGNITNVVIRNRYAGLDLKANDTEARIKEFLEELFWFANEYLRITGKPQDDISQLELTFNRSIIINTKEIIESVVASKGIISDRTAISNHPFVNDIDEELEQIAKEREEIMLNLDDENNNEEEGGNYNADEQQET